MTEILGSSKSGTSNTHTAVEYPDTVSSKAIARILVALGEGEMENIRADDVAKHVYLDGTVIRNEDGSDNFSDVVVEYRPGTPDQEPISGFPAVENEREIGVSLKNSNAWVTSVTNTDIDAVRIRLSFQLLTYEENGDRTGARVDYRIEYRKVGESVYQNHGDFVINDKQASAVERDHRVDLPESSTGWQIRVTRLTADSTSDSLINTSKVVAITTILDSRLRYPWTALLFVQFDAAQFQNLPKVSMELEGRRVKVPTNYNPETREYTGTWDGTFKLAYTNNPAWVVYDIALQKRFGLGRRIPAQFMDKWTMYRIGQRCDDLVSDGDGGMEPRHLCDIYIQKRSQAWTVIRDLVSIYNGMVSYGNQMLQMSVDQPAVVVRKTLTNNSIVGKFKYSYGSRKNRRGICHVSWDNPNNHYASAVEPVAISELVERYGIEAIELSAIGCIRRSEAQRRARWAILTNNLDMTVDFKVGLEGLDFIIGDVVAVSDEYVAGGVFGGKIFGSDGSSYVNIDRPLDSHVNVGDKFIAIPSGMSDAQTFTITSISDGRDALTLSSKAVFDDNTVFVLDCAEIAPQYVRIVNIKYNESDNNFSVTGLLYASGKYDAIDTGTRLDERPVSLIPTGVISPPESVTVTGYSSVNQGKRNASVEISWPQVRGAVAYNVQYRRYSSNTDNAGTSWINVQQQIGVGVTLDNVFTGRYQARVAAVGQSGAISSWVESNLTDVDGKRGSIPVVFGLKFTPITYGIVWEWNAIGNDTEDMQATNLQYRVIRNGAAGDWAELSNVTYPGATYSQMGLAMGQGVDVRARYITSYGDYGEWSEVVSGHSSDTVDDYYQELDAAIKGGETYKELTSDILEVTNNTTIVAEDIKKEADERRSGLAGEAEERARAVSKVAEDAAAGLLNEKNDRIADISTTQTVVQNNYDSLAKQISQVSAGTGIQFDSSEIWHFNGDAEGWTSFNGEPVLISDGWMRGQISESGASYATSPVIDIDSSAYRSVMIRVKKIGSPSWSGKLLWTHDGEQFSQDQSMSIAEPTFDDDGTYTVVFSDVPWMGEHPVNRIRVDLCGGSSESDFVLFDWIAVGRPAPGAGQADLENEKTARVNGDAAEASARQTLAVQMRGDYDGSDSSKLSSGLIYSEQQARIDGDKVEASQRLALATRLDESNAEIQKSVDAVSSKTDSNASDITRLASGVSSVENTLASKADSSALEAVKSAVSAQSDRVDSNSSSITALSNEVTAIADDVESKASSDSVNSLTNRVTVTEGKIESQGQSITNLGAEIKGKADSGAVSSLSATVSQQGEDITAQGNSVNSLTSRVGDAESSITDIFESVASEALAQNNGFRSHRSSISNNVAEISQVSSTMASENAAMAQRIDTVSAKTESNSAAIQEVATATTEVDGKVSAMWGLKVQTESNGVKHVGGIQLGSGSDGAVQFLIDADTFGVYNRDASGNRVLAFANSGGTSFLRDAMIRDASIDEAKIKDAAITNAKISGAIQSDTYGSGSGWRIDKSGGFDFQASSSGNRVVLDDKGLTLYNSSGVIIAKLGFF